MFFLLVIALIFSSYILAKMTNLFVSSQFSKVLITPKKEKTSFDLAISQNQKIDLNAIIKRNFFDSQESAFDSVVEDVVDEKDEKKIEKPKNLDGKAVKTSLPIDLISAFSVGDGTDAANACVINYKGTKDVYGINDSFYAGTKIVRVLPKRVEFLNRGRLEYVELNEFVNSKKGRSRKVSQFAGKSKIERRVKKQESSGTSQTIARDGDDFKISCSEYQKSVSNLNSLLTEIQARPLQKDGKIIGLKIYSLRRGSLFDKLGIRRGDLLKTINGTQLDVLNGIKMFKELSSKGCNIGELSMNLERRGQELSYTYEVVK